jgi:hypothetical protein
LELDILTIVIHLHYFINKMVTPYLLWFLAMIYAVVKQYFCPETVFVAFGRREAEVG